MSTENSAARNTVANDRSIEDGRLTKALTQDMDVREHAPGMYDVRHDGETYTVDVEGGSCGCKDHEFRGDTLVCKHVLRAAIHHVYVSGVDTRLVARTVAATDALGCVHGATDCNGPLALDDHDTIPCADCCAATGTGLWTVYCTLTNQTGRLAETDGSVSTDEGTTENNRVALADGGSVAAEDLETAYRAVCHDCSWSRQRRDVVAADDLGGEHAAEKGHLTEVKETETAARPTRSEQPDLGHGDSDGPELL